MMSEKPESLIVAYLGRRGKGKTLTMVKDGYNYYLNGWNIYTNMIGLQYEHTRITEDEIIEMSDKDEFMNCVILFDEIQVLIDSRRSNRDENVFFNYFIQQIRKRNVVLLFTTQFLGRVDKGLREHVDIHARPRMLKIPNFNQNLCEVNYIDIVSQEEQGYFDVATKVYIANHAYSLYNHKERAERTKKKDEK